MAMHSSYMRAGQGQAGGGAPSGLVPASPDEMHGFLKDKQAWEHAISLYQGPDPLDHWYNYICWYENHANSDPELKYRETLERCLTVYEHNDYYRQDARLVRLWLKYIAMQTDQLHFYQVLFQRGTGRQVAAFYIGWAGYYESREEFKDAEAVFNLAFQEKAQTHAELQHAHSKFNYARSVYFQRQQQQQHLQQQQQQILQQPDALQQLANYTQQLPQSYNQQRPPTHSQPYQQHPQQQPQHPQQQQQQHPQQQNIRSNIFSSSRINCLPSKSTSNIIIISSSHSRSSITINQYPIITIQKQHQQILRLRTIIQIKRYMLLPCQGPASFVQQTHYESQQPHQEQKQVEPPQQNQNQMTPTMATATATATTTVPVVASAPAAAAAPTPSNATHNGNGHVDAPAPAVMSEVAGLRLPRNFYAYGRNNHETWKPALTLEEPDDPSRICHYAKQLVYPPGLGIEYSPEELLARKYKQKMEERTKRQQQQQQHQSSDQQQEQTLYNSYNSSENSYYMTAVDGALYGNQNTSSELETKLGQQNEEEGDEEDEQDDGEEDEESEEGEEEEGSEEATDEEEEDEDEEEEEETTNGIQFSAQTTFEQSNRSIKIKFKKERTLESSSSAYSAYTIENVYQQREQITHTPTSMPITTPATAAVAVAATPVQAPQPNVSPIPLANQQRQRNGHHFHPYLLGQTSTPKSEANGYRRIRTKAKRNKFQADLCSNSNSSSSVTAANDMAGGTTAMAHAHAHAASFNDNANFSFSSATALDNSNSSLALAVDRLNFRDSSQIVCNQSQAIPNQSTTVPPAPVNKTLQAITNNNNNNNNGADFSTFQENSYFATQHDSEAQERRLSKALETIERHLAKEAIDPFNSELCRAFLAKLNFPGTNEDDEQSTYKIVQTPLPKISNTRTLNVLEGSVQFNIDKEVGRGSYGSVYKATDTRTGNVVALKYQKPPNTWEIYICDQVLKRITDPEILPGLMDISTAIIAPNASLIATEFSPFGSLLDINNKIRQATTKVMHESLVMHFSGQICNIVDYLHRQHIIHADIKPDNFLLMRVPNVDSPLPSLRLIDFGCAIDMTLFPDAEHTKFRKVIHTDGFTCIEMQESRPWSYETDLFCIAGTVHVMLFGEYMQPQKRGATWDIRQKLPRYLKKHVWSKFFGELLNMQADKLPQLHQMRIIFEEECLGMDSELQKQIRTLSNILHRR
ncbi:mitotic checkpoint serine/threonine-protein kinase BUB1 [Drosophila tropicalis]|uniref:mitotic checkpoint serine/threonine-protein kinase BUB1 n=1 Tax=Drosophila tropicalis TaxID=46794 RepID=UPI0035AC09C0